jgi:hypothetical protein
MSFELFLTSIKEPALLEVAAHWDSARGHRLMPAWRDIDPVALRRHLSIVWSWRYDFSLDTFVGRLAGEEIIAALGKSIRGRRIDECFPPDAYEIVRDRYKAVLDGPQFMHSSGKVHVRSGGSGLGERIVLPLAADESRPDGILGATVYRLSARSEPLRDIAIDHLHEAVTFYPLVRLHRTPERSPSAAL